MKTIVLLLVVFILVGCGREKYELVFEPNSAMNCYVLVYQFTDGTKVYSSFSNIKYKTKDSETSIQDALINKKISLSDIKDNPNLKIVKAADTFINSCSNS